MGRSVCCLILGLGLGVAPGEDLEPQKQRLAVLQPLVGSWRGVGQPQRGSMKGSWQEEASWSWSFEESGPALVANISQAKYFRSLRLSPADNDRSFELVATPAVGGEPVRYSGQLDDQGQLVVLSRSAPGDFPTRLTFRFTAGNDRLLVLMERIGASDGALTRLAEVGYTRQGSGFGKVSSQRECIVTGGLGTMEVAHAGKTYYVCCTGCRDYFQANADKVLAEYAARRITK